MSNPARPLPKMTIEEYFRKYGVFSDLVSTNILTFDELYKSYYDQFRTLIYEIVQIDGLEETPTVDETFLKPRKSRIQRLYAVAFGLLIKMAMLPILQKPKTLLQTMELLFTLLKITSAK